MRDTFVPGIIAITFIIGILLMAYVHSQPDNIVDVQYDTVVVHVPDSSLMEINDSLWTVIDSLNLKIEQTEEELSIAEFKLERIKEYNRIAASGNNITFLRGWINRVLNE